MFRQHALRGLLLVVLATFLFSFKGIFIKLAYGYDVPPVVLMTLRMLFALPFYLWVLRRAQNWVAMRSLSAGQLAATCAFGISGYYLASLLDLLGLVYLPANLERIILYSYPSIVLILSICFLGQRFKPLFIISLLIIYSGLYTLFMQNFSTFDSVVEREQLLGGGLVFAAAFAFAVYCIGSEVMMRRISSQLFTVLAMLAASIVIIVHYCLAYPWGIIFAQPIAVYIYALLIAIVCTVMPSFLLSAGIARIGAAMGSTVGSLGPVFTLAVAFIVLGESLSLLQLASFVLIIGGVFMLGVMKK